MHDDSEDLTLDSRSWVIGPNPETRVTFLFSFQWESLLSSAANDALF